MDGTSRKDALVGGMESTVPLDPETLAARAADALPPGPRAYLVGGAETEGTTAANRRAFDRWRIRPRVLCDTSERDHTVAVDDQQLPHPVVLAPVGMQSMYADGGEETSVRRST